MSSRRDVLAGFAGLTVAGAAGSAAAAAKKIDLDDPAANLEAYVKLRGDLSGAPVYDMIRGRVYGLVEGQPARPLFKTVGAQRTRYRRESSLEFRTDSRYVGMLVDWQTERLLTRWSNPYNDETCEVPVTRYGPSVYPLVNPPAGKRPWFVIGDVVHMLDEIVATAPSDVQPDADLMTFTGDWKQLADPDSTRIPSRLSFTAVENWREWMRMDRAGSLWWHVTGVKLAGPGNIPDAVAVELRRQDPDFFTEGNS